MMRGRLARAPPSPSLDRRIDLFEDPVQRGVEEIVMQFDSVAGLEFLNEPFELFRLIVIAPALAHFDKRLQKLLHPFAGFARSLALVVRHCAGPQLSEPPPSVAGAEAAMLRRRGEAG